MRSSLSFVLSPLALWAIRMYQRYLSPIKGYSCAYRIATGKKSCSAHGYRAIARHGLFTGLALLDRRLQRCGAAYRSRTPPRNPVLHYQRGDCDCIGVDCDLNPFDLCGGCGGDCGWRRDRRCAGFLRWREKRRQAKAAKLRSARD
jgi:putative component of membrane protein insertase Oxa1/YidC/SpoIIIJ protein YidD